MDDREKIQKLISELNQKDNSLINLHINDAQLELADEQTLETFKLDILYPLITIKHQFELFEREFNNRLIHGVIHLTDAQCDAFQKKYTVERKDYNLKAITDSINLYATKKSTAFTQTSHFNMDTDGCVEEDDGHQFTTYLVYKKHTDNTPIKELTETELAVFINEEFE